MTALTMNCPHCGSSNEFFVVTLPREVAVSCSHCGQAIGRWGDLVKTAETSGESPGSARSFDDWARPTT